MTQLQPPGIPPEPAPHLPIEPEAAPTGVPQAIPVCCHALEGLFDTKVARVDLASYRRRGPGGTTRRLVETLIGEGVTGASLIDIGGGVGAIQHRLLEAGASRAVAVDASPAYLEADRTEAARRGLGDRIETIQGDFVALAPGLNPADVVTLERVICCYPDLDGLVSASASRATRLYGLVYPRDAFWMRIGARLGNLAFRLRRSGFRFLVHPEERIQELVRAQGLEPAVRHDGLVWTVAVFRRPAA